MHNGMKRLSDSSPSVEITNQQEIRSTIIEAILKNERDYVDMLTFIEDVMKASLAFCAEQIEYEIDDGHVRAIFGNIGDILDVHKLIMKDFEKEASCHGNASNKERIMQICNCCAGRIIVKARDSLKVYEVYCSNFARSEKVVADIMKMTSLNSTIAKWKSNLPFPEDKIKNSNIFTVCLKEPLKYLCRCSVLLKVLSVFTSISHPDFHDVIEAYTIMHATVTSIEAGKRAAVLQEAYQLYEDLQEDWDRTGLTNKQGFLTKRGGNIKSWKIRWFTLRSYELKYFDEPIDEKSLGTLNLHQCKRVYETDSQMKPNCFGLVLPERTYFIYAISQFEKMEWVNMLAWKIYMLLSPEEKARLALSVPAIDQGTSVIDLLRIA